MIKTFWMHRVKDFNAWKKVFDSRYDLRKKYGEKSYSIGTIHGEPNYVYVINEWESVEKFNTFRNSSDLIEAMKNAGVLEEPKITILEEVPEVVHHSY
jgi:heme-degrading monooxygenase HmoA